MNLATLSIKRPTFIISIVLAIIVVGLMFMSRMSVDMFPDVNFPYVVVTTVYPGAGPEEVETLVSKPLEESMSAISGLKNLYATNLDGVSIVWGEFTLETNPQYAEQQVKDKLAQTRSKFPKEIEEPVVVRFDPADQPIMKMTISGDLTPAALYDVADNTAKPFFQQVPNVSKVDILGGTKREIQVNLDLAKLKEHESSVSLVAGRIGSNSENIPVGKVTQGKNDLAFRSIGEYRSIEQIKNTIVSFFASDVPVTIKDIGTVIDTTEEPKTKGALNGKLALILDVYKQSGSNTVEVSDNLQKQIVKLNEKMKNMKGSPKVVMARDGARPIRMNLNDVKLTILEGIFLAIIVVYLFLGSFRSTIITVVALPNSLIGAFIFMYLAGFSINMLSLMALSLAVGLLIDDAIVVRENIFRHIENGEEPIVAAQKGTDEVRLAVIASTLTVVAAFLPVGFLQGMIGQFFKQFGLTIVFAVLISLFDAFTTAPMLSAYMIGKRIKNEGGECAVEKQNIVVSVLCAPARRFGKFQVWLTGMYEHVIRFTLKHRLMVIIIALVLFFSSIGLVTKIPKTFMPTNEFGEFMVSLEAVPGTSLEQMDKYTIEVSDILRKEKDINLVLYTVGNSNGEANVASIFIKMVDVNKRKISTTDMKVKVRKLLEGYKEQLSPAVNDISMTGSDRPFNLMLIGDDLDVLSKTADRLLPLIEKVPGLIDVTTNFRQGKPEMQFKMSPEKMARLGVQSVSAGMELRNMVEGATPAKFREGGNEYDIRVHLQSDQRDLSEHFNNLYVPNVNMQLVKLKNIAQPVKTTGPSKIERRNRSRMILISGNLDKNGATGDITKAVKDILKNEKLPEGIKYDFIGQSEDMADLVKNMMIAAVLSIVFIYMVLASLYESILIPFTIMLALPLAIIGAFVLLLITGQSLNMFSMIGLIMLLGLVTKNSILIIDFAQQLMRQGISRNEALVRAGKTRLRPILMTTFAMIAGMLPLALGLSEVGKFRRGMGIAIIGGLISSTFLSLVVVPAVFGYIDDLRLFTRKLFHRPALREIDKIKSDIEI